MHPRKQRVLDVFGRDPETLDELAHCVIKVIESCGARSHWNHDPAKQENCKVVGFSWNISPGQVSNSHSAPLDGVTNWGGNPGKPSGYPGWNGRVWIRYYNPGLSPSSDAFNSTLTYPGTGGGGAYGGPWESIEHAYWVLSCKKHKSIKDALRPQLCSWDYRIYLSDWPALGADIEKQKVVDRLSGKVDALQKPHHFLWEDPFIKIEDAKLLAEYAILKAQEPYNEKS
jgi:hypothetical protein